jgi:hypothetical protein
VVTRLEYAIEQARRIRRNLVRKRQETDLGGDCGLASIFLADALGSVSSLRHTDDAFVHVWNEVEGFILDITATQFNDSFECDTAGEPPVLGVLVTREPRIYHRPVTTRGDRTLRYLFETAWYEGADHQLLRPAMERLRTRRRA